MNGIPPASIGRLKSQKARDFILLCLGISLPNDENPVKRPIKRPGARELLRQPFLAEDSDDEAIVEVDPPLYSVPVLELSTIVDKDTLGSLSSRSCFSAKGSFISTQRLPTSDVRPFSPDIDISFRESPNIHDNIIHVHNEDSHNPNSSSEQQENSPSTLPIIQSDNNYDVTSLN